MSPRMRFVTQIHKFRGDTMRKIIYGGLLASTMLVPAFAQTNPPAATTPSTKPSVSATVTPATHGDMWRASKLIGLNVYNDQNEKLGDISEVLLDKSGKVDGIVIGVGGFLGMGKHDILVQMDKLKFVNEPVRTSSTTSTTTGSAARPATSPSTTSASSTANKWYPDHAVLSGATKESLKNMSEFKFD